MKQRDGTKARVSNFHCLHFVDDGIPLSHVVVCPDQPHLVVKAPVPNDNPARPKEQLSSIGSPSNGRAELTSRHRSRGANRTEHSCQAPTSQLWVAAQLTSATPHAEGPAFLRAESGLVLSPEHLVGAFQCLKCCMPDTHSRCRFGNLRIRVRGCIHVALAESRARGKVNKGRGFLGINIPSSSRASCATAG